MGNKDIISQAEKFVIGLFNDSVPKEYIYHSYDHTKRVVRNALKLAKREGLNEDEIEILLLAAYFHDTGYSVQYAKNEPFGADIAGKFLNEKNFSPEKIDYIKKAILTTAMPQKPFDKITEILCDADLSNLGKKYFFEVNEMIRLEEEFVKSEKIDRETWCREALKFLENHKFHTANAEDTLGKRKEKNIRILINKIESGIIKNYDPIPEKKMKGEKKKSKNKNLVHSTGADKESEYIEEFLSKPPSRGIETMFRNNLRGHLELSGLADNKANIMLSINAVVLSIIVSVMIPEINRYQVLAIPTLLLILTCVTTIVFATISTRPKVTSGVFRKEDIKNKTANLLFFGNFHNMSIDDFQWGMTEMMKDKEFLYGSMIRDFYNLGIVLNRKYRYLRLTYSIFMFGIVISAIAYIITFLFLHQEIGS